MNDQTEATLQQQSLQDYLRADASLLDAADDRAQQVRHDLSLSEAVGIAVRRMREAADALDDLSRCDHFNDEERCPNTVQDGFCVEHLAEQRREIERLTADLVRVNALADQWASATTTQAGATGAQAFAAALNCVASDLRRALKGETV